MANVKRFAFGPMGKKGLLSQFKALASSRLIPEIPLYSDTIPA